MAEPHAAVEAATEVDLRSLVRQHLPALRRFARARLGTQSAGDAWVEAALEGLLAEHDTNHRPRSKADLLALLLATPLAAPASEVVADAAVENEAILVDRLHALAHVERTLLLLVDLEGLGLGEAGRILGLDPEAARARLRAGRGELRRQPPQRVLIVEDESLIALDLAEMVTGLGHEVVAIAATHRQAIGEARRTHPTLVLADIQLADDSSGIDAVNELLAESRCAVVFITAFPERLLSGRRPEPAFLVTKPFDEAMLTVALAQAIDNAPGDARG